MSKPKPLTQTAAIAATTRVRRRVAWLAGQCLRTDLDHMPSMPKAERDAWLQLVEDLRRDAHGAQIPDEELMGWAILPENAPGEVLQ